jgi:hypothetical protein
MSSRYYVRWKLLFTLVALVVVLPLVLWLAAGIDITPFVVAWILIVVVGASGAGLRTLRSHWEVNPSDVAQRETDRKFERPPDERGLL